jgi:hypothetical protein
MVEISQNYVAFSEYLNFTKVTNKIGKQNSHLIYFFLQRATVKTRSYSQPDLAKLAVKMIIINELSALTDSTKKISGKSRYTYEVALL